MEYLVFILKCAYFMLPAYFANMAPVIVKNIFKSMAVPLDFNKKFNGKPIFGNHKTVRGIIFGVLFAIIVSFLQFYFYDSLKGISLVDYSNWLLFGFLMGFGALFGDLIKSMVKRRVNIQPGQKFIPWDQLDFVIGALAFVSIVYIPSLSAVMVIFLFSFLGHITINHLAYFFKIRKEKW